MSTEGGKPAAGASDAAGSSAKPPQNGQTNGQAKDAPPGAAAASSAAATAGEKKLSGAELKKKQKEEKAARRMQAKAAQTAAAPPGAAAAAAAAAAAKGKGKQDGGAGPHGNKIALKVVPKAPSKPKATVPVCFSHLSMAKRMNITQADKDVHPVILQLGQQMSTFAISDSITRAEATLLAFKKVYIHTPFSKLRVCRKDCVLTRDRSLNHTQPPMAPPSPAISHPSCSRTRSSTSPPAAPCASPWETPSAG